MKSNPLISILIPCYNSRKFIKDTINSVFEQTYQNFEILLVDDGPPDPIEDVYKELDSPKIKYFKIENSGPAKARNFAAQHAQGEFVAFLNHDDIWTPRKLEEQLQGLEQWQAEWVASGRLQVNYYNNKILSKKKTKDYFKDVFYDILEKKYLWSFSSVMIKKSVFFEVGMFNGDIWFMDDRDLYLRIAKKYPLLYLSTIHVLDKVHASNITSNVSMQRMFDIHETVINNAKKLDQNIPKKVIENSRRMIYQTACIEYLRANDIQGMRKMLNLLKCDAKNVKFIPYRLLNLFNDDMIIKIMIQVRKLRGVLFKDRLYPSVNRNDP